MRHRHKVLVITPIKHIPGIWDQLSACMELTYIPEASLDDVMSQIQKHDGIFTNPNKSNVYLGESVINAGKNLKVICTASTGTNHIDKFYANKNDITILSLTEEREIINTISSTAEHSFALMLAVLRNIPQSWDSVKRGEWDYEQYIGRQIDHLTIGVIGYGRLGVFFSRYVKAFGAKVLVYDPYKQVDDPDFKQVELLEILQASDVISFHVHVSEETTEMVNQAWFSKMKSNVILVNTSRGEIMNEANLISFLRKNPNAFYATDVLSNETKRKQENKVLQEALGGNQILITPHIGGMTIEGQKIAYSHAAKLLKDYLNVY